MVSLPTATDIPSPTSTLLPLSPGPNASLSPTTDTSLVAWQSLPIAPTEISPRVREIYRLGQELGKNPNTFSNIGDCNATPTWFLSDFDLGPQYYSLGGYSNLQAVIDAFHGSFSRQSIAVRRGFSAASVLTPLWTDPTQCQHNEMPLACEVRLNKPAFAFILLGTNDVNHQEVFEANVRQILDYLIEQGVVPILATKADNLEGNYSINAIIARLADEYDLPLWNFWLAVQPLPDHGLQGDLSHLTWASNHFDDPVRMQAAWPWRNLTALQTLDFIWQAVTTQH
jgi:hypothetical protein